MATVEPKEEKKAVPFCPRSDSIDGLVPTCSRFRRSLKVGLEELNLSARQTTENMKPSRVESSVDLPEEQILDEDDIFTPDGKPKFNTLVSHFKREGRITFVAASRILQSASDIIAKEPNLLELSAPITVVGDLHGQFYDVLSVFDILGVDCSQEHPTMDRNAVFLGDYADRGMFGAEVCLTLLALKILLPERVRLLRGNHEARLMTGHFNFKKECEYKYGPQWYETIMKTFDMLPLAATVASPRGTFFCVHGGLSPALKKLEDLKAIDRFQEIPPKGLMCDLLWSDPLKEDAAAFLKPHELDEWREIDFLPNPVRGCSKYYGYEAIVDFLKRNNLLCIVRGHEVFLSGRFEHKFMLDIPVPPAITVFSAPNYCDTYGNEGSVMLIDEAGNYDFTVFTAKEHPYVLPNFADALNYSLPFVVEALVKFFYDILKICTDDEVTEEEEAADIEKKKLFKKEKLINKVKAIGRAAMMMQSMRQSHILALAPVVPDLPPVEKFQFAIKWDEENERRPSVKDWVNGINSGLTLTEVSGVKSVKSDSLKS